MENHAMSRSLSAVVMGAALAVLSAGHLPAHGSLIQSNVPATATTVVAGARGNLEYQFDSASQTGVLLALNTPRTLTDSSGLAMFSSDQSSTLQQMLSVVVDNQGRLLADNPANQFQLRGKVSTGGQTLDGVLLNGRVVGFGSQDLGPLGIDGMDYFDFDVELQGGLLASAVPQRVYVRLRPDLDSTFAGNFNTGFQGSSVNSITALYPTSGPAPIPEPGTWLITSLAFSGLYLVRRARRRV
jgi:hypothetical protein